MTSTRTPCEHRALAPPSYARIRSEESEMSLFESVVREELVALVGPPVDLVEEAGLRNGFLS